MSFPASSVSSQAEADLDRFFNLSLDLLCFAGLDGYFRRVNPSWTRVLGWTEQELLARPVVEFIHPEDRERTLLARARLAQGIPVMDLENRYQCKNGGYRWLSWQSSIDARTGEVLAVARDITERRESDQEHLVLGKLESSAMLAGGLAHDFNNLFTSLQLSLELLRLTATSATDQQQHLRRAQETVRAAQGLTRQLVTFSRSGGTPRRVVDLRPLLKQALELALAGSDVRAEFDFAEDLWPAEVEEAQIELVVRNLALNAREAMPHGGVVRLRAANVVLEDGRDQVAFSLADEGTGIASEAKARVFDPYFSTKERGPQKGMGLGLTICHAILHQHGGRILVDSIPGAGTTVRCHLPASRALTPAVATIPPAAVERAPSSDKARRVLVLDDEPWLLDIVGHALGQLGYAAGLAKDGDAAIALFRAAREAGRPYDAVILDLTVRGGVGGREIVRVLRELEPGLRAVLMTGESHGSAFLDHGRLGFQGALAKPFSVDRLRAVLDAVLAGSA